MSIYHWDDITRPENIVRLGSDAGLQEKGAIQCGHSHRPYPSSWRESTRKAAEVVFVQYDDKGFAKGFAFACRQHAGTMRSLLTRGGWSVSGVHEVPGVSPEDVARDIKKMLNVLTAQRQKELSDYKAAARAASVERSRARWDEERDEYFNEEPTPISSNEVTRSDLMDDEFGRQFVVVNVKTRYGGLTPKRARLLAAALLAKADEAEAVTLAQVKP